MNNAFDLSFVRNSCELASFQLLYHLLGEGCVEAAPQSGCSLSRIRLSTCFGDSIFQCTSNLIWDMENLWISWNHIRSVLYTVTKSQSVWSLFMTDDCLLVGFRRCCEVRRFSRLIWIIWFQTALADHLGAMRPVIELPGHTTHLLDTSTFWDSG